MGGTEKVTAGLAESNGSLPPGGGLKVTCGMTMPVHQDQLRFQRSVTSSLWGNFTFSLPFFTQIDWLR